MALTPLLLQLFVLASIFLSTSASAAASDGASANPPLRTPLIHEHTYPSSLFGPILVSLGFHGFSAAASSVTNTTTWRGPATIFAPMDSTLLACATCSVPLLLHEHIVPGLFPLNYMRTLAFGTKIETLASGRCITITFSDTSDVFLSGVKITHPDLYNDGLVAVHGLEGFISHLSSYSCDVERMTSLSSPHPTPTTQFFLTRLMLKDAMLRLSISGYGVVALALKVKFTELVNLQSMTVFALDDAAIFSGAGYDYVTHFRSHIVPNKLLNAADLECLSPGTLLPTVEPGVKLVVTTAGGSGSLKAPISINYVKIKSLDLIYNLKIVVHRLSSPFPHIHRTVAGDYGQIGRSGWAAAESEVVNKYGIPEMVAPTPVIESMGEIEDHHGL